MRSNSRTPINSKWKFYKSISCEWWSRSSGRDKEENRKSEREEAQGAGNREWSKRTVFGGFHWARSIGCTFDLNLIQFNWIGFFAVWVLFGGIRAIEPKQWVSVSVSVSVCAMLFSSEYVSHQQTMPGANSISSNYRSKAKHCSIIGISARAKKTNTTHK